MEEILQEIRKLSFVLEDLADVHEQVSEGESKVLFHGVVRYAESIRNEAYLTELALSRIRRE